MDEEKGARYQSFVVSQFIITGRKNDYLSPSPHSLYYRADGYFHIEINGLWLLNITHQRE